MVLLLAGDTYVKLPQVTMIHHFYIGIFVPIKQCTNAFQGRLSKPTSQSKMEKVTKPNAPG